MLIRQDYWCAGFYIFYYFHYFTAIGVDMVVNYSASSIRILCREHVSRDFQPSA
jgi:hypothetical protein